jgi:hypothetical protein
VDFVLFLHFIEDDLPLLGSLLFKVSNALVYLRNNGISLLEGLGKAFG